MHRAIHQYVLREDMRETYRQDDRQAWSNYQRFVSYTCMAETCTWLAQPGAGQNME